MAADSEKTINDLKSEFAELKSDVSRLAHTVKDMSGNRVVRERERVRSRAARSRDQAREAAGAVGTEIGERPLTSIATAFGVGFVVGKMLDR